MSHFLNPIQACPPGSRLATLLACLLLGACASGPSPSQTRPQLMPMVRDALGGPMGTAGLPVAAAAPAPTTHDEMAAVLPMAPKERRFSVVLNNASPDMLFMILLANTPLSVAVDPSLKEPMSVALKDVTLREALELLRDLHGLEYKVVGRHILVGRAKMQTRILTVDYPSFNRSGRSELRVLSGSITGSGSGNNTASNGLSGTLGTSAAPGTSPTTNATSSAESSRISTAQRNDLWNEIETAIKLMIGDKDGRNVVISPQSGTIVIRAFPDEIRNVAAYLEQTRVTVQRQVMLEAKIVDVQLTDSEVTGINWSAFKLGTNTRLSGGVVNPGVTLATTGSIGDGLLGAVPGATLQAAATATSPLLGLAIQTSNFAAVLDFLSTQGSIQVLSSPRIATLNNQNALLKVGTDDFFVTNISSTTTAVGNSTATTPNISVQPFFSGISLDVTPNIDAQGWIILHVHPAISTVTEKIKVINLGSQGTYSLPLASSDINESDAVVRAHDGQIIAIGGLMTQSSTKSNSGVPGTQGSFMRTVLGGQTSDVVEKRELVILIKPTIIDPNDLNDLRNDALQRLLDWTELQQPAPPLPGAHGTGNQLGAGLKVDDGEGMESSLAAAAVTPK